MKKIIFITCAMCLALNYVNAQVIVENNLAGNGTSSTQETSEKDYFEGTDIGFNIDTDSDIYGISFGGDQSKNGYMTFGMKMGFGDISIQVPQVKN